MWHDNGYGDPHEATPCPVCGHPFGSNAGCVACCALTEADAALAADGVLALPPADGDPSSHADAVAHFAARAERAAATGRGIIQVIADELGLTVRDGT